MITSSIPSFRLFPSKGVAGQALHLAQQRLTYDTVHSKGTCRAFPCPIPDQDL